MRPYFSHLFSRTLIEVSSVNFKAKFLKMASINSEFLNVSMVEPAPESATTLVSLTWTFPYASSPTPFRILFKKMEEKLQSTGRKFIFFKHCTTDESPLNHHSIDAVFSEFCPHEHSRDHLPTPRGQSWTFDQPPTHLILSTWFLNDPLYYFVLPRP